MRHELLAPAGSFEICKAVIAAGADAVYLGGEKFSARALAPNFSETEILRALDLAHLHGRKIYLALNTLLKNRELDRELYCYIKPFYEQGLDAIIVQDYGVFQFVKRYFPDLPVHISTQMTVANSYGAAFLREKGAERIIASRELSLEEIRAIREKTGIEIECFVHGALCYCYSGQCLMSSLIGGRSGNRGRCAQPCRLPYQVVDAKGRTVGEEAGYPLSLKDLCAIDLLPQLCEAGVTAFKIEGRMKSLAYAAGVTGIYRRYLDLCEQGIPSAAGRGDTERLLALGNRSGFTEGYYRNPSGRGMLTLSGSSYTSDAAKACEPAALPQIPVEGRVTLRPGRPMELRVRAGADPSALTRKGEMVQQARKHPLSREEVRARMEKTGETPFVFSSLEVDMEGDCFVPVGQLNELRRAALAQLQEEMLRGFCRPEKESAGGPHGADAADVKKADAGSRPALNVVVCKKGQLEEALAQPFVDMISLDPDAYGPCFDEKGRFRADAWFRDVEEARVRIAESGKRSGFCFPYVFRAETSAVFERSPDAFDPGRFHALWVRSYDSLGFCLSHPQIRPEQIRLDAGVYVFSEEAWRDFSLLGLGGYTAPYELNGGELSHMPNAEAQFPVYGRIPVMVSAQCVYSNCASCVKKCGEETKFYLSDRFFHKFYIKRNCKDRYNVIYNSRPLSLFHRAQEIGKLGFGSLRITLVDEDRAQTAAILRDYRRAFVDGEAVPAPAADSCTNGHFRRGVE